MPFGKSAAGKNICCIVNFSQRCLALSPRTGSPVPHSTLQICTTCTSCEAHACASCAMTPMRSIACRCAWHDASQGERRQHEWQQDRRTGNTEFKLYTKSCCHGLHCYLSQPVHIICEVTGLTTSEASIACLMLCGGQLGPQTQNQARLVSDAHNMSNRSPYFALLVAALSLRPSSGWTVMQSSV